MDVIVDGQPGFAFGTVPDDVLSAVAAISDELHARGRALLSLRIDGQDISPRSLSEGVGGKALSEVAVLEVRSEGMGRLAQQTLAEVDKVLQELPDICRELAAIFQGSKPEDGVGPFAEFAAIWRDVKDREAQVIHVLGVAEEALLIDGAPLTQAHLELNRYLEEALGALESKDYVLMGDLLEYEFAPRIEAETKTVRTLMAHAEERAG